MEVPCETDPNWVAIEEKLVRAAEDVLNFLNKEERGSITYPALSVTISSPMFVKSNKASSTEAQCVTIPFRAAPTVSLSDEVTFVGQYAGKGKGKGKSSRTRHNLVKSVDPLYLGAAGLPKPGGFTGVAGDVVYFGHGHIEPSSETCQREIGMGSVNSNGLCSWSPIVSALNSDSVRQGVSADRDGVSRDLPSVKQVLPSNLSNISISRATVHHGPINVLRQVRKKKVDRFSPKIVSVSWNSAGGNDIRAGKETDDSRTEEEILAGILRCAKVATQERLRLIQQLTRRRAVSE